MVGSTSSDRGDCTDVVANLSRVKGYQRGMAVAMVAALGAVEIGLLGGWAATGATPAFVLGQLFVVAIVAVAVLGFRYQRFRRAYEHGIAEAAVDRERARMAEEVHDALGHELSVIALRAGALQVRSTGQIEEQAAILRSDVENAVIRLRETVELLRDRSSQPVPYEPSAQTIEHLIARTAASGAQIDVTGIVPADLPVAIERTAYRIVREGLTNAVRHAPGEPITITITTDGGRLGIQVTNTTVRRRSSTTGSGIGCLRRRVTLLEGELTASVDGNRHVLMTRLPMTVKSVGDVRPTRTASPSARSPLRATLIPGGIAGVLVLGFYAWATHGAALEEDVFAGIAPGNPEAVTRQHLPSRQSPVRLASGGPYAGDWTCAYYTDGNFPLGMAAFEICFHDDKVVRVNDLRRGPLL